MSYYESIISLVRGSDAVAVLREHALCPSGYVREAVLRRCAALNAVTLLPAVVARLHDWVPQVRLAAREALVSLMPLASAAQLAAVLPEILRLRTYGRGDSAAWLAGFETTLLQTLTPGELCAVARGQDRKAARAAVSLIDRHGLLAPTAIVQLILDRRDDIVLAQRAIELSALLPPPQQVVAYRAAASSHFGAVRTVAVKALLAMAAEAHQAALAALEDAQASVRQAAIGHLLASGFDVRGHYRDALAQGGQQGARASA